MMSSPSRTLDFEELFSIFSSPRFLKMEGTGNEVPLFIKPYAPELEISEGVEALVLRLRGEGFSVLSLDLFDLVAEVLEPRDQLKRLVEKEAAYTKSKLYDAMRRLTDPKTTLIPAIQKHFASGKFDLTILHGVGSVFPYVRTHSLLENLQPAMVDHPVAMFFPGDYLHQEGAGSTLSLFGRLEHKGYYRAFNLDHYHL
ncbi:DUF1788 domain-containing protein [Haloferula sp.]|uniref:DUF1788 domain-containing protein n=1 Tax=Haloferula sp. TaxID=2497595 RepID=UPI00329D3036